MFLAAIYQGQTLAVERILVEALFTDKAMVSIDGVRRLLKLNQTSPEGVRLISASSSEAVLEVDGEQRSYPLGGHITTRFSKPELVTAKVWRNQAGAYTTVGTINGRTVNFLVDTGATAVAMHANQAKRLGISYRLEGNPIYVNTASGTAAAYDVVLDRVQVGDITLTNVRGFVIDNNGPGRVLLGMSFLNRVKMEDQGSVLILEKKF
ncbi:MAG: aspartyl protease [gamma proteobacterium symbiont of Ctena orbiculata]|uniref:TIGR02281 family clan AA aspartic protease n=1 Tax=Candidatus Thiodiazotropha taylori TaxID=2792791 RepID=A0A944M606_9GAMM|nr:TIGR02281 family clan AA aspartic protease [Candidatus Thiodiazotropha taylori]PUB87485.1 MAG: TIGR02281 family clan AA aspartic protease [gamma proteobacterium symbiont of Ctena orbiculata]MBT2988616.1 TIGR02281 family clan AA aspartic protease [Candidatus Thiodiazotropha taylori]MBT2996815.1 TIGR02281 family clan AA aspartic protease [Candidatus Thiodiazotropha taylori]MBT3002048.1 TIGR02281 family clan AA aspartic protease [Candidatus Thiodiazotropha taylori]